MFIVWGVFGIGIINLINDFSIRNILCSEYFDRCVKGDYEVFLFYKFKIDLIVMRFVKENYFIKLFFLKFNKY